MADILTHLRELSFGYGILKGGVLKTEDTPLEFLNFCQRNIENCTHLSISSISKNNSKFSPEEYNVILNGLKLSKFILSKNIIKTANTDFSKWNVRWLGMNTQSGLASDIIVEGVLFSLKEESFILHNMGLYQLINIIIDKHVFQRGLHIFETFANNELDSWFLTTRDLIIKLLKQESFRSSDSKGEIIEMIYSNDRLNMFFNGSKGYVDNFSSCDYTRFKNETNSYLREKVFSKFLNNKLSADSEYLKSKKKCAEAAGSNLVSYLKKNLTENPSPKSLFNLFRINTQSYYYAKTTNKHIEVYKIPSQQEFSANIKITNISFSVPQSQLNIFTTIENINTKSKLVLRNELRYSHGQLNGTPEAKMYIDEGSLLIAYEEI
jgi:hypothetical protein